MTMSDTMRACKLSLLRPKTCLENHLRKQNSSLHVKVEQRQESSAVELVLGSASCQYLSISFLASSIDTPLKVNWKRNRQEELKKIEQDRKARAKAVQRSIKEHNSRQNKKKTKREESDEDLEESEGLQFCLQKSLKPPVDLQMDEETEDRSINHNTRENQW
ncbi:hypothetical protein HHI36_019771 [Cryptolaemus montrouzieri]|uniref:Uncharacterized protein n=1 Tax=Cryptolaemus montrouzieri TaxID=559131 RepID=A0ABD2N8J6_9CUCU